MRSERTRSAGPVPGFCPPGWPASVRPPGSDDWLATATAFLFDCCPADFRAYPVLQRHPVVLARFADRFVEAQCVAATDGLAEIRVGLRREVPPEVIDAAAETWQREQARLVRTKRAVGLVEQAIRGTVFTPQL